MHPFPPSTLWCREMKWDDVSREHSQGDFTGRYSYYYANVRVFRHEHLTKGQASPHIPSNTSRCARSNACS